MGSIFSEFLKLKRSMIVGLIVILPVIAVLSGAVSTAVADGGFENGWHTLWIRSIGFYGMVFLPVAIGVIASLVWRVEHKQNNWNALMSRSVPTAQIVIGKVTVIAVLAAAMQIVLLATILVLGAFVFRLPGTLPSEYYWTILATMIACLPVAALQSAFSTFLRSFAAPIAIALVGAGISTMLLTADVAIANVIPYAVATQATQLGTALSGDATTIFNASAVTIGSVGTTIGVSLVLAAIIVAATSVILNRTDTRT